MARHCTLALGVCLMLAGCAKNGGPMDFMAPPPPPDVAYVSPDGGDLADGTENAPFASLRRALETDRSRIVLFPGRYAEPDIVVSRAVQIEGPTVGKAVLDGHLFIAASQVTIRRLDITNGLALHLVHDVEVQSATIAAGAHDDALSVVSSRAQFRNLWLTCGEQTCVQTTGSTAAFNRIEAWARPDSKRIIRVETSSVVIQNLYAEGGSNSQLQASAQSTLQVRGATLAHSLGNGLVALKDSKVHAYRVTVVRPSSFALLVQKSEVTVQDSHFDAGGALTVGVTGGRLQIRSSTITAAVEGALSLSQNSGRSAQVTLRGGVIDHGAYDGVLVTGGRLQAFGTHFRGSGPPSDHGDAIVAHGVGAELELRGIQIVGPAGFGVVVNADATAIINGTITEPGRGGVLIDDVAVQAIVLRDLVVSGCRNGSGVTAWNTPDVQVQGGSVTGCDEAGYLAGQSTTMTIRGARAIGNREYGFAAFGGSLVRLQDSAASGSRWSTFASCGDGARIEIDDNVELTGQSVTCP